MDPEAGAGADDPFRPHASSFSTLYSTECIRDEQTVWSCSFGSCILKSPVHLPLTTRGLTEPAGSGGELVRGWACSCNPRGRLWATRHTRAAALLSYYLSREVAPGYWWGLELGPVPLTAAPSVPLCPLSPGRAPTCWRWGRGSRGWVWGWGSRGRPQSKAVICPWTGGSPELPCTMFPGSVFARGLPTVRSTHDL